jgi:prolyl-tRNA synthetase
MGSVVEASHDEKGMIWPKSIAPFHVHMVSLGSKDEEVNERIRSVSEGLNEELGKESIDILWDDRTDVSAGEKFADADLIGIPLRLVISEKSLAENAVEWKLRNAADFRHVRLDGIREEVVAFAKE